MVPPAAAIRDALAPPLYPDPPARRDPEFLRAAQWLSDEPSGTPAARLLGLPFSALSLSGASCDLTPVAVRAAMWSFSTWLAERGVDLSELAVSDMGDVRLAGLEPQAALDRIRDVCAALRDEVPVALVGGDNSVTAAAFQGLGCDGLLTIDAHHDLRTGLSNGSPVRVLVDAGLAGERIWQIGIADLANSRRYSELADQLGITVIRMGQVRAEGVGLLVERALASLPGRVYVDVDVDAVERALAPGCPAALPGGLAPADLVEVAFRCGAHTSVAALDVVEVDPERDVAQATVRLAAQVLLSFLAGVATR